MRDSAMGVASDLLDAGFEEAKKWAYTSYKPGAKLTDTEQLRIVRDHSILIVGFMVTSAIVFGAEKIAAAIMAKKG